MENSSESAEEKITTAAIECLEKYGVQGATIRKIAEMAGMNSAAINYYFRSKEALIQHAMERTLENAFDWKDIAMLPGKTAQEHCAAIFINLVEGGVNYPGITRAHFFDLLTYGNYDSLVVTRMNGFVLHLAEDLKARGLKMPQQELETACMQITACVFMLILSPKLFASSFHLDMTSAEQREAFINDLVDKLLQ
jgi:Transcriptional regulator